MRVEWVSDRLPDKPGWYLVTAELYGENFDGRRYAVREMYFKNGCWASVFMWNIVAWMEIPEPWVPNDV